MVDQLQLITSVAGRTLSARVHGSGLLGIGQLLRCRYCIRHDELAIGGVGIDRL